MSMTWPKDHVRSESRKNEKTSNFFSSFLVRFFGFDVFCVFISRKKRVVQQKF